MALCEKYEIDESMCSHCLGHTGEPDKVERISPVFPSRHPGACGCCGDFFPEGSDVAAAMIDGERKWVLAVHTKAPNS